MHHCAGWKAETNSQNENKLFFVIISTPFLTEIDPKAAVKGSRDPLGIQTIWARLGRHVVGNITTVSNSVRDFTILVLGHYFAEQVAYAGDSDGDLAVFLRWEQLASYARGEINNDWGFRGVERVRKNLQQGSKVHLGADAASQILSNQKTYGIWGLYTVPGRSSGLLDGDPTRLTPPGRDLVENLCLPTLNKGGPKTVETLIERLAKTTSNIHYKGSDRPLLESVAKVLGKRISSSERDFYRDHLLYGGPADKTEGGQRILVSALETTLATPNWSLSPTSVRLLAKICRGQGEQGEKVADRLERIRTAELLLAPAAYLFELILASDGQTVQQIGDVIRKQWKKGLSTIDVDATALLEAELRDSTGDTESGKRWVNLAGALAEGDFNQAVKLLLEQNRFIMNSRAGALPWAEVSDGKLRVRFRDESGRLPELSELKELWRHSYFIDSLWTVADQLKA